MRFGRYDITLEPRTKRPAFYSALTAVGAILLALVLASALFLSAQTPLLGAYRAIFSYAFFNPNGLLATIHRSIYLLLCTYAFLVPLRAGLWNIGLPGQVYAGGIAAFAIPFIIRTQEAQTLSLPPALLIVLMVVFAAAAGAAVGGFAGILRARFQVNEILVTMMLNFILFWLVAYIIKEGGPFMSPTGEGESFALPPSLHAPLLWGVPFTAVLALGAAVFLDILFAKTPLGYRIRAFGQNPAAARYGGIIPLALSLVVFLLGGGFAGLAGYHYFASLPGVYKISGNYGYYGDLSFYGIISALIARGSSLGAIPIAVLFAGLSLGARFAQGELRLPFGVDYALLGLLMITFVASHVLYQSRVAVRRVPPPILGPAPTQLPPG